MVTRNAGWLGSICLNPSDLDLLSDIDRVIGHLLRGVGEFTAEATTQNFALRNLSELVITLTELKLIAALASIGVTRPKAANGTLRAL